MTSRKLQVRGIFDNSGELIRILHTNGGGKTYFMDVEPSKDASIDEFCLELMPPQTEKLGVVAPGGSTQFVGEGATGPGITITRPL